MSKHSGTVDATASTSTAPITPPRPLLEMRTVDIAFGNKKTPQPTVFGVNLSVYPGQTVAIVGESGSGKTTTSSAVLHLLPGTGHVTGGQIIFDGEDITHASEKTMQKIRGNEIGYVPQDPMSNLNPVWTIGSQLEETLIANDVPGANSINSGALVEQLLSEAGLTDVDKRKNQYPFEFSGGMKQRALIAMGLAARPQLLIADEPTSALDVTVQKQILDHLESLTQELGTAVLLITHDLGLAAERAQHVIVMSQGRIVESGPALEVLQHPQHEYTKKLVAASPSLASHSDRGLRKRVQVRSQSSEQAEEDITSGKIKFGGDPEVEVSTVVDMPASEVLRVNNLNKTFDIPGKRPWKKDKFVAAEDINFVMNRGDTLALVGESGSGKSTVARMTLGLLKPTSGQVLFDGTDVTHLKRKEELAFRKKVQPVFQNPYGSIDPMYSVFNTIAEPLRIYKTGDKKKQEARVRELLDMVAMPQGMLNRYPTELSGGQRQRIAIARALALNPEVVVLDEAVSALDVLVQSQILDLLNNLQAELGLSYLFITHDLAVVKQIADDVLVMRRGKIVERGTTQEIFDNPQEDYTRNLIDSIPGGKIPLHGDILSD